MGNTQTLRETALVEAFNLKAAIEFNTKNLLTAREALTDMPPRMEEEVRCCHPYAARMQRLIADVRKPRGQNTCHPAVSAACVCS